MYYQNSQVMRFAPPRLYIINHAKFYEEGFAVDNKEEYYRMV